MKFNKIVVDLTPFTMLNVDYLLFGELGVSKLLIFNKSKDSLGA